MMIYDRYSVEPHGNGFLVADYSGQRGEFGAAYCGEDGIWRSQPIIPNPFKSEELAKAFAEKLA